MEYQGKPIQADPAAVRCAQAAGVAVIVSWLIIGALIYAGIRLIG